MTRAFDPTVAQQRARDAGRLSRHVTAFLQSVEPGPEVLAAGREAQSLAAGLRSRNW